MYIQGKYNNIVVKTKEGFIEEASYKQLLDLANDITSKDAYIRIMPDYHAGAGNVIGMTMDLEGLDLIVPDLIGPDIGCGVNLVYFKTSRPLDLEKVDRTIRRLVPTDKNHDDYVDESSRAIRTVMSLKATGLNFEQLAVETFGTLGGGNHFIEIYEIEPLQYALSVHSGSRSIGAAVHKYYNNRAGTFDNELYVRLRTNLINTLKLDGKEKEIQNVLKQTSPESMGMTKSIYRTLSGQLKEDYIYDLKRLNIYTERHRTEISSRILNNLDEVIEVTIGPDKPHNYVGRDNILRKGAQSGRPGEEVLIPINMRDGMLIGRVKKDNELAKEWNYSMPHGAGRVMSRSQAKRELDLEAFKETMGEVFTTSVGESTLDEAPDAYKSIETIFDAVYEGLEDIEILKPIYNYKGE